MTAAAIDTTPGRPPANREDDKSNDNLEPRRLDARYATSLYSHWGRNRVQELRRAAGQPMILRGLMRHAPIQREIGFWLICGAGLALAIWHYVGMVRGHID